MKAARLKLARWPFGAGLVFTFVGAAALISFAPFALTPGIVLLVVGLVLPRR